MTDPIEQLHARFRLARLCTLACMGGLVALFVFQNLSQPQGSIVRWLVQAVPLLIVLPGIIRDKHRSYSWLCFIVLIYFTVYVVEVMAPPFTWPATLGLTFAVAMFISSMLASRWLQHWQYQCSVGRQTSDVGR